jgi:hypothetical protein
MKIRNKNGLFKNHNVIIKAGTYRKDQTGISGPQ